MHIIIISTVLILSACKKAPVTTKYNIPAPAVAIGSDTTMAIPYEYTQPVGGTTTVKELDK